MAKLSDELVTEIQRLCTRGDNHADAKQYSAALQSYWSAWELLPDPKTEWRAATSILVAIGDTHFLERDYRASRHNLLRALKCPDAFGDPFLYLRLGQCNLELETFDRATDALMRAYLGGGPEIFKGEDPKYHRFLQGRDKSVVAPKKAWQFWR